MKATKDLIGKWILLYDEYALVTGYNVLVNEFTVRYAGHQYDLECVSSYVIEHHGKEASIYPDFRNAKQDDSVFSPEYGNLLLNEDYDDFVVTPCGDYYYDGKQHYDSIHPTLFHSFDQFFAYWHEYKLKLEEKR